MSQKFLRRKIVVSKEIHEQRLEICRGCEKYKKTLKICGICFCFLPAKTYLAGERCPMNPPKWDKETDRDRIEVVELDPNEALPLETNPK